MPLYVICMVPSLRWKVPSIDAVTPACTAGWPSCSSGGQACSHLSVHTLVFFVSFVYMYTLRPVSSARNWPSLSFLTTWRPDGLMMLPSPEITHQTLPTACPL